MLTLLEVRKTSYTVDDIARFILKNPTDVFKTAFDWPDNFLNYIRRLYDQNFIAVFTDGMRIKGLCGWFITRKEDEGEINKIRWTLPEDITGGNVLYVGFCLLTDGCCAWKIKKMFEELGYRKKVKEVVWFTRKWVRLGINDGHS